MVNIEKNDIIVCVEWFTQCNLNCDFCYNFLENTIESNKKGNFDLVPFLNKIEGQKIFLEAGGEMLLAPYFVELMEYKQNNIKDYKALLYSNGEIPCNKFNNIINELKSKKINMSLVFSPHYYNEYGYVYINLVVTEPPKVYLNFFKRLLNMNIDNIYINISYDYRMFEAFDNINNSLSRLKQIKTKKIVNSYKPLYDYIRENFIFLNYGRGVIKDKFTEIQKTFNKYDEKTLDVSNYNPSLSYFVNFDKVIIHVENKVIECKIKELDKYVKKLKADNSNVSQSEILTFHICAY